MAKADSVRKTSKSQKPALSHANEPRALAVAKTNAQPKNTKKRSGIHLSQAQLDRVSAALWDINQSCVAMNQLAIDCVDTPKDSGEWYATAIEQLLFASGAGSDEGRLNRVKTLKKGILRRKEGGTIKTMPKTIAGK